MKARLNFVTAAILAGSLVSCQQAFTDTQARESGEGVTASLSSPSYTPGNTSFAAIGAPDASLTAADAGTASSMASSGLGLFSSLNFISPTASASSGGSLSGGPSHPVAKASKGGGTTNVGSGLSGYVLLTNYGFTTYNPVTDAGELRDNSDLYGGTYSSSVQDYEEASPQYFPEIASPSGAVRFYKKALHRVYNSSITRNINYTYNGSAFSGVCVVKQHSEWYKDIYVGTGAYTTQYGITEYSFDFALSQWGPSPLGNGSTIGGKFVGSYKVSVPYSGNVIYIDDTIYNPLITISEFGTNGQSINNYDQLAIGTIYGPSDATQGQ